MCPGMIRKVKKRYEYIDYVKALIIIIVVMVHTGFDMLTPISNVCMIVLVVCSGITLSLKEKPLKEMIVSRFKRIMLPFWGAIAVYSVFEVWRAGYLGYSDYKIAYPGILAMFYGVTAKMPVISGITDPLGTICQGQNKGKLHILNILFNHSLDLIAHSFLCIWSKIQP